MYTVWFRRDRNPRREIFKTADFSAAIQRATDQAMDYCRANARIFVHTTITDNTGAEVFSFMVTKTAPRAHAARVAAVVAGGAS